MTPRKKPHATTPPPQPFKAHTPRGGQPLMTTLRETRTIAGSVPSGGGLRTPFEMDEYRQDIQGLGVDGNTALAPMPSELPASVPAAVEESTPPRFTILETRPPAAAVSNDWIGRVRTLANANPGVAAVVLGVVALATLIAFLATRPEDTMSIAKLKHDATALDGQSVLVKGRIGEVYQMGSSYAYLLHQGRDTVVVYTRSGAPIPGDQVTVSGSVSTGYLDGVPRVTIFQTPTP